MSASKMTSGKLFLMVLGFLFCPLGCVSQYWDFVYDSIPSIGRQIILTHDSCYLVTCTNSGFEPGFSLKLDQSGNILWFSQYGGYSICQTFDNKYIIAGSQDLYAKLTKIDENGNFEWVKTYGEGNQEYFNSVIQSSDSCFIACGKSYCHEDRALSVVKTDTSGNVIWKKCTISRYFGSYNDLLEFDHNLYIVGEDEDNNSHLYTMALKLTLSGAEVWKKSYEIGYGGNGIALTPDSDLIVAGGCSLTKMNLEGDTLWRRQLKSLWVVCGVDVLSDSDSGYILCGSDWTDHTDLLARFDKNGTEIWYQTYPTIDDQYSAGFASVIYLPDDGFITCGCSNFGRDQTRLRVLKTNLAGGGFVEIPEKDHEYQNVIYPNPSDGIVFIDFNKPYIADIFDINGKRICSKADISELDFNDCKKGLYIVRITYIGRSFCRKIIIK